VTRENWEIGVCWNGHLLTIAAGPPNQGFGGIYIHGSLICQVMPMTNQLTCRNGEISKLTSRDVTFNIASDQS
jgi:hypothetical protein